MQNAVPFLSPAQNSRAVAVAIYTRVSTDAQTGRRFDSCEHQTAVCREHIDRKRAEGWFEFGHFSDEAYSGATLDRPGIRRLMHCIAAGQVEVLLVYRLERILRSISEWTHLQDFLREHGCRLVSPSDDHSDRSASGRLKSNMMMSLAEYERSNVAEKTRSKLEAQAKRGMWGGGYVPFGYDYDRSRQQLIPNPGEATVLKRIFDRAGELASLGQIAAELTHEGVRSGVRWQKCGLRERRSIGGRVFRTDVLRKIIGNPLYRGVICYGGKEYTGQHEPLVGKEAWELANAAILEPRNKRAIRLRDRDTHSNLLKGILVCEVCQQPLLGKASGKPSRSGSHYRYYHCAGRPLQREAKPACQVGNLPAPVLEKLVVTFLGLIPKQDATAPRITLDPVALRHRQASLDSALAEVERELKIVQSKIDHCTEVLACGGIEMLRPEIVERATQLTRERQPLLVKRAAIRQEFEGCRNQGYDAVRVREAFERLSRVLPSMPPPELHSLLSSILARIDIRALERSNWFKAGNQGDRVFRLSLSIRVANLLFAMEQGHETGTSQPTRSPASEFEFECVIGRQRRAMIVAPFRIDVGEVVKPAPVVATGHEHPIHRATRWGQRHTGGTSVRAIARADRVSPSLVSLHLKLMRLPPEAQRYLRDLRSRRAVQHFSLRRLAALVAMPREEQAKVFAKLRADLA